MLADNRIWFGPDGNSVPALKQFLSEVQEGTVAMTIWDRRDVGDNQEAARELKNLGLVFEAPKPTRLVRRMAMLATTADGAHEVFDFFAGSGTTGRSVINLNREDGGNRRFLLVDMGEHIDTVLLPHIQKVMFTPEWKDGKPVRMATKEEAERTPRLVKVLRLEGYEDALHNLVSEETLAREAPRTRAIKAKDRNGRRVLVLWRDMEKLDPAVERKFLEARFKEDGPFDEAWINGDCAVPGVQSLDGLFKRLLEEEER